MAPQLLSRLAPALFGGHDGDDLPLRRILHGDRVRRRMWRVAFEVRFNGEQVHDACRGYLRSGTLPLPLSRYVTTEGFRGISDQVISYRMAGSFVLYLTERFGLPTVLRFFQTNNRDETLADIRMRMELVFGLSLEDAEAGWLERLRQ